MKVSVLIPVYNKAHCIRRCLNSMIYQTYKDLEILVYDDGSTDDSVGEAYSVKDSRIRIIRGKHNAGISHARNVLMEEATGKMCAWQDADDYSNPWRIETQVAACKFCGSVTSRVYRMWISRVSGGIDRNPAPNPVAIGYRRGSFAATLFPARPIIPFHLGMKLNHEILWGAEMCYMYGYPVIARAAYYYYSDEDQPYRTMKEDHPQNTDVHYWDKMGLWKLMCGNMRVILRRREKSPYGPPTFTAHDIPPYLGNIQFNTQSIIEFQRVCRDTPFKSEATCVYLSSTAPSEPMPAPTMSPLESTMSVQ